MKKITWLTLLLLVSGFACSKSKKPEEVEDHKTRDHWSVLSVRRVSYKKYE